MLVVHVSGSVASGKSTLLRDFREVLQKQQQADFKITTKELDDFAQLFQTRADWQGEEAEEERGKGYVRHMSQHIADYLEAEKKSGTNLVLLAGLTLWIGFPDRLHLANVSHLLPPDSRFQGFFIDIPVEKLVEQTFEREVARVIATDLPALLAGSKELHFSTRRIKHFAQLERNEYVGKCGYALLSSAEILSRLATFARVSSRAPIVEEEPSASSCVLL